MLELRPACENCGKQLPYNNTDAMICSFECTFCSDCVNNVLQNVCPNCGGGFEKRPIRPKEKVQKYPMKNEIFVKPVQTEYFEPILVRNKNIAPENR